jgi:perosamine synthetase
MLVSADQFWSWKMFSMSASANHKQTSAASTYSFFWARNAIYHSLKFLNIARGSRILVPAYICRAAVDPLITYGLDVDFYSVKRDCAVDLVDLERRITKKTSAVLLVHYFGFPQNISPLREICDEHQIALIEDCAQVLCGEIDGQSLGTIGDAAVFSWRKFLPVFDGADLVINRPKQIAKVELSKETPLFTLKVAMDMVDRSMRQTRRPAIRAAYNGLRTVEDAARKCTRWYIRRSPALRVETSSIAFDTASLSWPMSRLSRWTKTYSNVTSVVAKRRRNYETLKAELVSASVTPLFPVLPPTVCPWVFPVFFDGLQNAQHRLRDRGIPAAAWDGVRHPRVTTGSFIDSDFLYQNLVFLPIHQCLEDEDIHKMVTTIRGL